MPSDIYQNLDYEHDHWDSIIYIYAMEVMRVSTYIPGSWVVSQILLAVFDEDVILVIVLHEFLGKHTQIQRNDRDRHPHLTLLQKNILSDVDLGSSTNTARQVESAN